MQSISFTGLNNSTNTLEFARYLSMSSKGLAKAAAAVYLRRLQRPSPM